MAKLKKGKKAPEFELPDQDGKMIRLSNFMGKKVVLFFYPQDNTPTCTEEACNLRDNSSKLKKAGFVLLGISPDSPKKHRNFISKYDLPFTLLCDEELVAHKLYGTWGKKQLFGREYMGTLRTTFVIDEKGYISRVIDKVKAKEHAFQILEQES